MNWSRQLASAAVVATGTLLRVEYLGIILVDSNSLGRLLLLLEAENLDANINLV